MVCMRRHALLNTPLLRLLLFTRTTGSLHFRTSPELCFPAAALLAPCLRLSSAGHRALTRTQTTYPPYLRSFEHKDDGMRDPCATHRRYVLWDIT